MNNTLFLEEEIDISPLLQVCLESEMTWNNIFIEGCEAEFNAILKEDVQLLNEAEENIIKKLAKWIMDKIRAIRQAIKDIVSKIMMKSKDIDKFTNDALAKLKKGGKELDREMTTDIKTCDWKSLEFEDILIRAVNDIANISNEINNIKTDFDEKEYVEKINNIRDTFTPNGPNVFLNSNKTDNRMVVLSDCISFLKYYATISANIKAIGNTTVSILEGALADLHHNNTNASVSKVEQKRISLKKRCVSAIELMQNTTLTLHFRRTAECLRAIRKALY